MPKVFNPLAPAGFDEVGSGGVGPQGPSGAAGAIGAPGFDGADGEDGALGPPGPAGAQGSPGTPGSPGAPGAAGPMGALGQDGLDGEDGPIGPRGLTGPQGVQGTAGTNGVNGSSGPPGMDGLDADDPMPLLGIGLLGKAALPLPLDHHTDLTNLTTPDDHTQYLKTAGRAGGQTQIGGLASGETLTLQSTSGTRRVPLALNDALISAPPAVTGTGTIGSAGTTISGSGTVFLTELGIGDTLIAGGQRRSVNAVNSNTLAGTNLPFAPVLSAAAYTIQKANLFKNSAGTVVGYLYEEGLGWGSAVALNGGIDFVGFSPASSSSSDGAPAAGVVAISGTGGASTLAGSLGGAGGAFTMNSGPGGATVGAGTAGAGGSYNFLGGFGGAISSGTSGIAGAGATLTFQGGTGGNAPASNTNGGGGNVVFNGGSAGAGAGTAATPGSVILRALATGRQVCRIESVATNDDPTLEVWQFRGATTDATANVSLGSLPIVANNTYFVEARIVARRTGGTAGTADDGAAYIVLGTYKTAAGVVTLIGALNLLYTAESVAAYNATLGISTTNVQVQVTGVLNTNITWHATVFVKKLST